MNAIASLLARAKAYAAPPIVALRRVRPVDRSSAAGFVFAEDDGWIYWRDDDRVDHCSRADYLENSP